MQRIKTKEAFMNISFKSYSIHNEDGSLALSYPAGISYATVSNSESDGGYRFSLGASIIKFKNIWLISYLESLVTENDTESRFVCKYSFDECKSFSNTGTIAGAEAPYSRSHGVFYNDGETLWAYCPKAMFGRSTPECLHPNLTLEAYRFNEKTLGWELIKTVLDEPFWPMCEPIRLSNGRLVMAGINRFVQKGGGCSSAVAISDGDPLSWRVVNLENPEKIKMWAETTVVEYPDRLVAFIRTNIEDSIVALSESFDSGDSWTPIRRSDIQANESKFYAGTLSDGRRYFIRNIGETSTTKGDRGRLTLAISVEDREGVFGEPMLIRHGFDVKSKYFKPQWAYPYAVEDDGKLYVVYSKHKENTELAIIPIKSLK